MTVTKIVKKILFLRSIFMAYHIISNAFSSKFIAYFLPIRRTLPPSWREKKVVFTSQVLMYDALPLLKQSELEFEVFANLVRLQYIWQDAYKFQIINFIK
jgi:hypothetical protein